MPPSLSATSAITASTRSRTSHRPPLHDDLAAPHQTPVALRFPVTLSQLDDYETSTAPPAILSRLILAPVPVTPSPYPYLSQYPPAQHALQSLLTMLARHSPAMRPMLLRVAVHGHLPTDGLRPITPREAVALDFVRAVVATPPRIPIELRTALRAMHTPDRIHNISLVASFAAYYSTITALLALNDAVSDCQHAARTMRLSINGEGEFAFAPRDISHASSSTSSQARAKASARKRLVDRVALPLRLKVAVRSMHQIERSAWLAHIPTSKRSQDDFINAAMGFTPLYLHDHRLAADRAVFIYILDHILLRDGPQHLSVALKNLVCYILARCAENSVLTAHSAFLAHRFGARDEQLAACMDVRLLHALRRSYAVRHAPTESSVSSTDSPPRHSRVRKRGRHGAGSFPRNKVLADRNDPVSKSRREMMRTSSFTSYRPAAWPSAQNGDGGMAVDVGSEQVEEAYNEAADEAECGDTTGFDCGGTALDSDDDSDLDVESSDGSESEEGDRIEGNSFSVVDEPEVPEVHGLNLIDEDGYAEEGAEEYGEYEEDDEEADRSLFSQHEVAFLLLAHEVAQASRRNSRMCAKYAEARPGSLVCESHCALIRELFEGESIIEMMSVIGAFHMLQRWTACYPYRPGSLEAPVRRFVQSAIAHDLCVGSVGQRSSSKCSDMLRAQQARSLGLPRHSVVHKH